MSDRVDVSKGIFWADSVQASNLAQEIALHFGHDCHDSMCGEDADASDCEFAWVEDKLADFLEAVASPAQQAGGKEGDGERTLVIERLPDWSYGAFVNKTDASCIAIGETAKEAEEGGWRRIEELLPKGKQQ